MKLSTLALHHFRTYSFQTFSFAPLTIFLGKNTIGKTNILEAIHMLSTGKSFRAEKDVDTIQFGAQFARIDGILEDDSHRVKITVQLLNNSAVFHKRYFVNDVGKRLIDFESYFSSVMFSPQDLELISESPSLRRKYLDTILSASSKEYRVSLGTYTKALKQRNRLLGLIRDGKRYYSHDEFGYWNSLLLEHSAVISNLREQYVDYMNTNEKSAYPIHVVYDKSAFTESRLEKYRDAELASGVTLIGPQRDDLLLYFPETKRLIREFASRGEQRLAVLQLKLLEIEYVHSQIGRKPVLLLDDIFSELDSSNIAHISRLLAGQQAIITTAHLEHVPKEILDEAKIIRLPEDLEN